MFAQRTERGFTLIELMIVVAVVGVLSALAIPSYRDYVVRTTVAEALQLASVYKDSLTETVAMEGDLPAADQDFLVGAAADKIRRVKWSIGRQALEIWFGRAAGAELDGTILWLIPAIGEGSVVWTCRAHSGAGGAGWKIDARYLPATCRT